jgi:hypothetical protein
MVEERRRRIVDRCMKFERAGCWSTGSHEHTWNEIKKEKKKKKIG